MTEITLQQIFQTRFQEKNRGKHRTRGKILGETRIIQKQSF